MAELITEPEKIITNFSGIENIVNAVLAKMDVPELKGLEEINMVFSAEQFFRLCRTYLPISGNKDEIPQGKYDSVAAFYFKLSDEPQFFIIMKANQFSEILPTYFHEIGHVANDSFLKMRLREMRQL